MPMFHPDHRAMLERHAARGCPVSRYMLDHNVWYPEAIEGLHRERCREPVPVPDPDEEMRIHRMIDREEWR
jgi:hypothetical protein